MSAVLNLEPYLPGLPDPLAESEARAYSQQIAQELEGLLADIRSTYPEGLWSLSFQASQQMVDRAAWLIERLDCLSKINRRYLVNHPLRV